MIKPGIYECEVIDSGLTTDKEGKPSAWVKYKVFTSEGKTENHTEYYRFSTDKQAARSAGMLVKSGFVGNEFTDLNKTLVEAFSAMKLNIKLEKNEYTSKTGEAKENVKMAWVSPAKKVYTGKMDSFAKVFTAKRSELGIKKTPPKPNFDEDMF